RRLALLGPGLGLTLAGLTNYHSAALREGLTACLQAVSNSKHYTSIRRAHRLQPEGDGPPTATTSGRCVYVSSRDLQEAGETARSLASRGQLLNRWAHSCPRPLQDIDRSRGACAHVPAQGSAGDHCGGG